MKKLFLVILVGAFLGVLYQISGTKPALAEDKYGGILKVATNKGVDRFNIPPIARAWPHPLLPGGQRRLQRWRLPAIERSRPITRRPQIRGMPCVHLILELILCR